MKCASVILIVGLSACSPSTPAAEFNEITTTTAATAVTTSMTTTSTTITATTTTSVATSTTTTLATYDWDALTYADVVAWKSEGYPEDLSAGMVSCEIVLSGLQNLVRAVGEGIAPVLDAVAAAEAGTVPVSEAQEAVDGLVFAVTSLAGVAKAFAGVPELGDVAFYATDVQDLSSGILLGLIAVQVLGFDIETDTVDSEALQVWLVPHFEDFSELVVLGQDGETKRYCN